MNDMNPFITQLVKIRPRYLLFPDLYLLLIYSWKVVYKSLGIKVYEVVKVGWPSSLIEDDVNLKGFAVSYCDKQSQTKQCLKCNAQIKISWSCMMNRVDVYSREWINTAWAKHSGEVNGKTKIFKKCIYLFIYLKTSSAYTISQYATCNTSFAKLTLLDTYGTKHNIKTQVILIGSRRWSIRGQTHDWRHR